MKKNIEIVRTNNKHNFLYNCGLQFLVIPEGKPVLACMGHTALIFFTTASNYHD
jgi:hypothetical protein